MVRRLQLLTALIACVGVLAIAASASASASATVAHSRPVAIVRVDPVAHPATAAAVAKFLLHAGIAYYVFDHYIWKPWKAGDLHGFTHTFTIAKAAVAALFVYHEVKEMAADVQGSKTLSFLAAPITAVIAKLDSLKSAISGGNLNAIGTVQSGLGSIEQQAGRKGVVIKEIVHAI
jgi:hypothetical protein